MNVAQQRIRPQLPPDELLEAIDQFNGRDYLKCSRKLQFLSLHEPRRERNLYQGIIQIATGLYHWQERDYRGCMRQLKMGVQLVQRVSPVCLTVDVDGLIQQTDRVIETLEELGLEQMDALEYSLLPTINTT